MNAPDTFVQLLARTRESFPASTKSYITGSRSDLRVPVRDIALTNGEVVSVYDTSGPYTDPAATIDVKKGLQSVRAAWIAERGDTEQYEGRKPVALDDGRQSEDAARLAQLRQEAAALQRQPRRAKAGANVTQTLPDSTAIEESHSGTGAIAATAYASCRLLLPPLAIEARRIEFARTGTLKCSATKKMVAAISQFPRPTWGKTSAPTPRAAIRIIKGGSRDRGSTRRRKT